MWPPGRATRLPAISSSPRREASAGRPARLRFVPWEEWREGVSERDAAATWYHIAHSPNCSIDKAVRSLGYRPRYGSLQAVWEALDWMTEHGTIDTG